MCMCELCVSLCVVCMYVVCMHICVCVVFNVVFYKHKHMHVLFCEFCVNVCVVNVVQ